jgi:hypothetical protein
MSSEYFNTTYSDKRDTVTFSKADRGRKREKASVTVRDRKQLLDL